MTNHEQMKARRLALGLTQRDVARELGVRQQEYSRWERGDRGVTEAHLDPLARLLGLRPQDLVSGTRNRRPTVHMRSRRRTHRRPYPNGATFEEMLRLGRFAEAVARQVGQVVSEEEHCVLSEQIPRDTGFELLLMFIVTACGGRLIWTSPAQLHCPALVMDDFLPDSGAAQMQWALLWSDEGEKMILFPQIRLKAPYAKWSGRVDFLVFHKVPGRRAHWLYVELDGRQHPNLEDRDATRAEGLLIPEIRYDNRQLFSEYWFPRFLEDVRHASRDGVRRAAARRRIAEEQRRERVRQVEARRAAA